MDKNILETRNLSYKDILHYPDMNFLRGKTTFIQGESGSGKSTLLKLFNGTLTQSTGSILYNRQNTLDMNSINLRKEISLVSQSVYLFNDTIKENFHLFYGYRDLTPPTDNVVSKYLELCKIRFPLDKDCSNMSGGEKQRVYISIFLSFSPSVFMMDEPTSALDNENATSVMENVISHCKEKSITVVIVSHDRNLTEKFADKVISIDRSDK